jgi:hypothetical protein
MLFQLFRGDPLHKLLYAAENPRHDIHTNQSYWCTIQGMNASLAMLTEVLCYNLNFNLDRSTFVLPWTERLSV